ncbi:MAG TPA: alpha/beta hydrolase [Acidimicrobiales bacterium]|nr:alpha/beta hydrolase [Acidimicrobiales bacterium]
MTAITERRFDVAEDVSLYARDRRVPGGDVGVPPLPFLLVHGLASNCRLWDGVAARLFELGHPVVAVDLRGHGRSDKPEAGYDFATLAADLVAVLDRLEWQRAVVAGQSMGGNLALELAAVAPARIVGVAGVDGGVVDLQRRWPVWEEAAAALAPPRLEGTPRGEVEAHLRRTHPDWSDEGIEAFLANFEALPDGTVRPWLTLERHMALVRSMWEHRPLATLARVAAPLLLVMADTGDEWAEANREEARLARAARPDVDVEWFSPADHDLHVQRPREVADLLHDRLGRVGATSS